MISNRNTLTADMVLKDFNISSHPLYFIDKVKIYESEKPESFLNFQANNPFAAQASIKQVYPNVATRAYYPHTLLIKTR